MTDTIKLEKLIAQRGVKKGKIAETLGISYHWLKKKINNEVDFKAIEVQQICELLGVTDLKIKDDIFFKQNVGK